MKPGDSLPFVAPFSLSYPKAESVCVVTKVHKDGTIDVIAEDGFETPYAAVMVIADGADHPANGPFAIAPPASAKKEKS